ncbi:twin-arginine translocase TatA/TatE family subunit [Hymenobacter ruricola]|uniref:Sec-independent protein translocase protein TatA n=1 Tax=Hymenobacter ruricola TaxID=2791023 RepID=A0ABS0I900_9BACT|nr:twin-arginine translocase TatA/TatE family subunit [Hymenobacter ruricola]MBF9223236.1 twin-arginine translocase TatA/TatE family subunit [Hymenobacter ruricola]
MFGDIGGSEVILILVVILIFFGANKIPELARGLGKGIREFKDASTEIRREFEQAGQQPAPPANNYSQHPNYGPQNQYPAPLPTADAEPASGFDPWATPAYVAPATAAAAAPEEAFQHKTEEPAPPVAHQLPPNLAPEGTQPRQPYIPANASPDA